MPAEVESGERRRQIGEAALQVVRERGAAHLTIRSVAETMGGSTTLVTHYVRNRRELLILAFTAIEHRWAVQDRILASVPAPQRFERLAEWGADWSNTEDEVLAALLLHVLADAKPTREDLDFVHQALDTWHRDLGEAAQAADVPNPWDAADLVYLLSRGAMLSAIENPVTWTPERLTAAARNLNRMLRPSTAS